MKALLLSIIIAIFSTIGIPATQPDCPCCKTYKSHKCVYWVNNHHMTAHEIQNFEIMEMRYTAKQVKRMTQAQKNRLTPWFKLRRK